MIGKLVPFRQTTGQPESLSDDALVAACGAQDSAALGALFDRYADDVHAFVYRIRGIDDGFVDDIVQETFLHAFESASRFRGGSSVRTWLLAIAANTAKTHIRGEIRRRERGVAYVELHPKDSQRPDQAAQDHELLQKVQAALDALPHDQRVAFTLCDIEEVRGIDAAKSLGIRQGTLYKRLHDARRAIRTFILGEQP